MIVTIKNESIKAEISTLGAELQSVMCDGREYLWNGDEKVWSGRAPLLFPICGGLKEDKYTLNGKEYSLPKHGYARVSEFEAEKMSADSAVFLLKSNEESKKCFPFDYELRVKYELCGKSVKITYNVLNKSKEDMYFSIGAHEGYACPEGIEEYSVEFEKAERLTTNVLNGNLLTDEYEVIGENLKTLPLKYEYFSIDALTFLNLESRSVTLLKNDGTRRVRVDFDGFSPLFLWTKPGADYICIEPWCGLPDFEGSSYDIKEKRGINKISPNENFERVHTFTIEK